MPGLSHPSTDKQQTNKYKGKDIKLRQKDKGKYKDQDKKEKCKDKDKKEKGKDNHKYNNKACHFCGQGKFGQDGMVGYERAHLRFVVLTQSRHLTITLLKLLKKTARESTSSGQELVLNVKNCMHSCTNGQEVDVEQAAYCEKVRKHVLQFSK